MKKQYLIVIVLLIAIGVFYTLTPKTIDLKPYMRSSNELSFFNAGLTSIPSLTYNLDQETIDSTFYVDFTKNNISSISNNLYKLPNINTLNLSYNKLKRFKNKKPLPVLNELHLHKNNISKVNISDAPMLHTLNLGYNNLTSIDSILNLTSLKVLHLQHNNISSIEGISKLENLEELHLEFNPITDFSELDKLKNLKIITKDIPKEEPEINTGK